MGAERALRRAGYHLVLDATGGDPTQEQSVASAMLERRVGALLIISGTNDHGYLAKERDFGTPVIFVGRPPANIETDTVLVDDRLGVREAPTALLQAGHQRIGVIHGVDSYPTRERVAGYLDALREHGVGYDRYLVVGDVMSPAAAATAAQDLLAMATQPTALLGLNRGISVGIVKAILHARTHAPRPPSAA